MNRVFEPLKLTAAAVFMAMSAACSDPVDMMCPATEPPVMEAFMGDSITYFLKPYQYWPFVNWGINGETSAQMLARFDGQIVAAHPRSVVILAGTNDLQLETAGIAPVATVDNIAEMAAKAKRAGICVVLATVPYCPGSTLCPSVERLHQFNSDLVALANANGYKLVDYNAALGGDNPLPGVLSDGLHPSASGADIMLSAARGVIDECP